MFYKLIEHSSLCVIVLITIWNMYNNQNVYKKYQVFYFYSILNGIIAKHIINIHCILYIWNFQRGLYTSCNNIVCVAVYYTGIPEVKAWTKTDYIFSVHCCILFHVPWRNKTFLLHSVWYTDFEILFYS